MIYTQLPVGRVLHKFAASRIRAKISFITGCWHEENPRYRWQGREEGWKGLGLPPPKSISTSANDDKHGVDGVRRRYLGLQTV